jgi:glycosyltransferase involved in cell wall biosynthesis
VTTSSSFAVLLDPGSGCAPAAAGELALELRDRLGPRVPIDVFWPDREPPDAPPGVRLLARGDAARALSAAAARGRGHLLVLTDGVLPDPAAVAALVDAFERDPMVGFAQPRFGDLGGEGVWSTPGDGDPPVLLPRSTLALLPEHYLTVERAAACLAIRREVAASFAPAPWRSDDLAGALAFQLRVARRRGFRNLVLNRIVVRTGAAPRALYPEPGARAARALEERFPEREREEEAFPGAAHRRFERVAARARPGGASQPLPVLLDCRSAQELHNGTSEAILGLVGGLAAAAPPWRIDLLCGAGPARFHGFEQRFPGMRLVTTDAPSETYAAAVRLDQPWRLSTVAELHRCASALAVNMLDTIAWDVGYLSSREIDLAWRFVAEWSDGLLFNSRFTQARFAFRFPVSAEARQEVTLHSLDPAEHRDERAAALPEADHVLVFGNGYEHKAVAATLDVLCRAFPYQVFHALGLSGPSAPNVTTTPSGLLPHEEIDRLVATARLVVFPSFYEGFGLPAVKALAYGRTVVVRASPLWREIAGATRMPGRLAEFTAADELVELVGRALAGGPLPALPMGGDLAGPPPRWLDCAGRLVALVDRIVPGDARRWYARDRALELANP